MREEIIKIFENIKVVVVDVVMMRVNGGGDGSVR